MESRLTPYPFAELLALSTLSLATTGEDGQPYAAPVYFAAAPLEARDPFWPRLHPVQPDQAEAEPSGNPVLPALGLYFFSDPGTHHAAGLERGGFAAGAIYPECEGWEEIRGLQLSGPVDSLSPGTGWETGWQVYSARFPFAAGLQEALRKARLYRLRPSWIRWLDNRRGFGSKLEWRLG
jgi:uncharacterized protein YhbP (UPF0306 family)